MPEVRLVERVLFLALAVFLRFTLKQTFKCALECILPTSKYVFRGQMDPFYGVDVSERTEVYACLLRKKLCDATRFII